MSIQLITVISHCQSVEPGNMYMYAIPGIVVKHCEPLPVSACPSIGVIRAQLNIARQPRNYCLRHRHCYQSHTEGLMEPSVSVSDRK